jgi:sulfatase maturation enzyme AslB (radical SAM superfamily)
MTKCAAFYNHTNIRSGNRVFPCCRYKTPIQKFDGDVGNILNSKEYYTLRHTWSIDDPSCAKCKYEESLGKTSLRQWFNKNYTTNEIKLRYLEVGFDNICDLTCDGCWEEWSSSWWIKKNPNLPAKQGVASTTEFRNIPESVEKVVFLGGEPLMTNRHRRFLESFNTLEHLEVEYFTNGMHSLKDEDFDLLKKCKHVHFTVSIDGYGELNETVRSGSVWDTVIKTLNQIANNFEYTIHTTIHRNNWHGLPEMFNWTKKYSKWTTNILTFPRELDIINLEQCDKNKLKNILQTYDIPNKEYIESHLKGDV